MPLSSSFNYFSMCFCCYMLEASRLQSVFLSPVLLASDLYILPGLCKMHTWSGEAPLFKDLHCHLEFETGVSLASPAPHHTHPQYICGQSWLFLLIISHLTLSLDLTPAGPPKSLPVLRGSRNYALKSVCFIYLCLLSILILL